MDTQKQQRPTPIKHPNWTRLIALIFCLAYTVACSDAEPVTTPQPQQPAGQVVPTPAPTAEPSVVPVFAFPESPDDIDYITVAIDVPDRTDTFERFDEFGNVIGFDADIMAAIATAADADFEFIVTPFRSIFDQIAMGKIDASISAITLPDEAAPTPDIAYTRPYLEVGQVLVVRANDIRFGSYNDVSSEMKVSVVAGSIGFNVAREQLGLDPSMILPRKSPAKAIEAVSLKNADAAIVSHFDAALYQDEYNTRIKIVGENAANPSNWITKQQYVMAVSAENTALITKLNDAIGLLSAETKTALANQWFVEFAAVADGEKSLIGTPDDRVVIGVAGDPGNLNPADSNFSLLNWEIKSNVMSGLMMYDADNNLVPGLAAAPPEISADGTIYQFTLRPDLTFQDGSPLNGTSVQTSMRRSSLSGNRFLNGILKDDNLDGLADEDAIAIDANDPNIIRLVLKEPAAYVESLLATPPFYIINATCDPTNFDLTTNCFGIGPYIVTRYESTSNLMRLEANPNWPHSAPITDKVDLRFFPNSQQLSDALTMQDVDLAWHGLTKESARALRAQPETTFWGGPNIFKSYLVFVQSAEPWDDPLVREAVAYAVDRDGLASDVFDGNREPLYSPLPDSAIAHVATEPQRDLEKATELLNEAGYSTINKLTMDLWFIEDRYTELEGATARALKAQLEETGIIEVNVDSDPWDTFRQPMSSCELPVFLLGWPAPGQQVYAEAMHWINYFVNSAAIVCSDYESEQMDALMEQVVTTTDYAQRQRVYGQIQQLWAEEYPTLDLTQESVDAVSLTKVSDLKIDSLGILHYGTLTK